MYNKTRTLSNESRPRCIRNIASPNIFAGYITRIMCFSPNKNYIRLCESSITHVRVHGSSGVSGNRGGGCGINSVGISDGRSSK